MASIQVSLDNWFVQHAGSLKTAVRVIFGLVWMIDGGLKFQPGLPDSLSQMVADAGQGQPAWLQAWLGFWSQTVSANPAFFVTTIGLPELRWGFALVFAFVRELAYIGGALRGLIMWSVPE